MVRECLEKTKTMTKARYRNRLYPLVGGLSQTYGKKTESEKKPAIAVLENLIPLFKFIIRER